MSWFLRRLFHAADTDNKLHKAIERKADNLGLQPGFYQVKAIYAHKENPITEYRVDLDPNPEPNPPPP